MVFHLEKGKTFNPEYVEITDPRILERIAMKIEDYLGSRPILICAAVEVVDWMILARIPIYCINSVTTIEILNP